jgi:5-methyltetrahydropteroyltriglutamate--homocysteine methyltransferase
MTTPHIPARFDHVGSFLRPAYLLEAREQKAKGQITPEQLRVVEDKAITEIIKFQEDVGLKSITDGEFRRTYFHIDFLEQMGGVKTDIPVTIERPDGTQELAPPVIRVIDKVRHVKDIQLADFNYLKSQIATGSTPKVTIPSPTMLHFRGGRAGISKDAYPELDPVFYDDVAKAYGDELRSLAAAGCTYVQMDDTNLAYLCDDKMREAARARGDDPNELPHRYAAFINKVVAQKPAGMTLAMHLCRGNFKSTHAAAGTSSDDLGIEVPPTVLAKAFAQYAKNQKMLAGAWRKTTPIVQTSTADKPSATDADGRKTGTRTARAISLGASPELRRMIGI